MHLLILSMLLALVGFSPPASAAITESDAGVDQMTIDHSHFASDEHDVAGEDFSEAQNSPGRALSNATDEALAGSSLEALAPEVVMTLVVRTLSEMNDDGSSTMTSEGFNFTAYASLKPEGYRLWRS